MRSWSSFALAAPDAAAMFEHRLLATDLALLATTRADGFPRICPVEAAVVADGLYIGAMPDARKSADLRRDPRCCLHSATADKNVTEGDAKLFGRALDVVDADERHAYAVALQALRGTDVEAMSTGFDLFLVDIVGATSLAVGDPADHLRITTWAEGGEETAIKRF